MIGAPDEPARWAIHFEYQLQPDPSQAPVWLLKTAALARQLGIRVLLVVIYLERGNYATFPTAYSIEDGGLKNEFIFHTIRLWEHVDRVRGGDLAELAPLLPLCEDRPTQQTLREERRLILGLEATPEVRSELLAVAFTVGLRYFSREVLERLFRRELQVLKEASVIQEWIEQATEEGEARRARAMLRRLLSQKFGELPEHVVNLIEQQDPDWCEEMLVRAVNASSLAELGL